MLYDGKMDEVRRKIIEEDIISLKDALNKKEEELKKLENFGFYTVDDEPEIDDDKITINLNNRKLDDEIDFIQKMPQNTKIEEKTIIHDKLNPNEIENNLFVQKAEEKEVKKFLRILQQNFKKHYIVLVFQQRLKMFL